LQPLYQTQPFHVLKAIQYGQVWHARVQQQCKKSGHAADKALEKKNQKKPNNPKKKSKDKCQITSIKFFKFIIAWSEASSIVLVDNIVKMSG
jgi:hypothetical protein